MHLTAEQYEEAAHKHLAEAGRMSSNAAVYTAMAQAAATLALAAATAEQTAVIREGQRLISASPQ